MADGRWAMGTEHEGGIPDDQARIVFLVGESGDIGQLGIAREELRLRVPHVPEQQFEQRNTGHRAATDHHAPAA
jgi:hypothetical protein